MLSLLQSILVGLLSGYLAITNSLATEIADALNLPSPAAQKTVAALDQPLTKLDSSYEPDGRLLPQILIDNAAYQQAGVGNATLTADQSAPLREALVNIFCQYQTESYQRTITGTGFFINADGVIMTNAHVAQFLLLDETMGVGASECVIRTGNPAAAAYSASLLYISPAWVLHHANLIAAPDPSGTGERDYALLYITAGTDGEPLPGGVPRLVPHTKLLSRDRTGSVVEFGGYPAESALASGTAEAILQRTATSSIVELFTFGSNYADVFSLSGTPIGERGISGGPVVDDAGEVVGLITTKGNDQTDGAGSLHAITLSYIDRTIREETGFGLAENISGNLPLRAALFKDTIVPFLKRELRTALE